MQLGWYAVSVDPGEEARVAAALPVDETFVAELPADASGCLYPGYVFARLEPTEDHVIAVLAVSGVRGFVGGRSPAPVPDHEVERLRDALERGVVPPVPPIVLR